MQNRLAIAQTNEFFSRVIRIDEEVLALEVSEAWANEYRAARATTPGPSNLALRRTNQTPQPLYKRETLPLGDLIAELNASRIGPAHSLFRVDTTNSHKPDPALSGVSVDDEAFQTYSAIVYLALYLAGTYTSSSEPGLTSLPTDLSNSLHTTEAAISTQGSYALHVEKRRAHGDRYRNFKKGKQDASAGSSRPDMDPKDGSGGAGGGYEDKDGDPDHSHDDPSSSKPDSASNNEAGNGGYPRGGSRLAYESVPTGSGSRINLIPSVPPGVELGGVDEDFAEGDDLIAFGESADESEPFIAEGKPTLASHAKLSGSPQDKLEADSREPLRDGRIAWSAWCRTGSALRCLFSGTHQNPCNGPSGSHGLDRRSCWATIWIQSLILNPHAPV